LFEEFRSSKTAQGKVRRRQAFVPREPLAVNLPASPQRTTGRGIGKQGRALKKAAPASA